MITDRWKFTIKIILYGVSSFQFTVGINPKSFPWPAPFVQETYPKFSATSDARSRVTRHAMS